MENVAQMAQNHQIESSLEASLHHNDAAADSPERPHLVARITTAFIAVNEERALVTDAVRRKIPAVLSVLAISAGVTAISEKINVGPLAPGAANAEVLDTGGYPWTDAPQISPGQYGYAECPSSIPGCKDFSKSLNGVTYGLVDPWQQPLRQCSSYVAWRLHARGIDPRRFTYRGDYFTQQDIDQFKSQLEASGELVNHSPAPGAVIIIANGTGGHTEIVESINGDEITISGYNFSGDGSYYTAVGSASYMANKPDLYFVHFSQESPKPQPNEIFEDTRAQGTSKLTKSRPRLNRNRYLQSPDKRFRVLLTKAGNLALYGEAGHQKQEWSSRTSGRGGRYLKFERGSKSSRLVLRGLGKKAIKSWNLKRSTQVKLTNKGELAGYRGNKKIRVIARAR